MRLLIVGASGFLGSHVRRAAVSAGMEVVTAGRAGLLDAPAHRQVDCGVDDPVVIGAVLRDVAPDVVVNCAGAIAGAPALLATANVTLPYSLITALRDSGVAARLVHLGSAAEYGLSEPGVAVTETHPPRPIALYGVTKLAGTRIVQVARGADLDAVVLRVFNPIGLGASPESLPGRLMVQLRQGQADGTEVRLGSLEGVRDFIDGRDVADAVLAAATVATLSTSVINVGSGTGVPVRTLVKEMVEISGYTGPVHEDESGSSRSAPASWQEADIRCAHRALGWVPRRDLETSLTDWWEEST